MLSSTRTIHDVAEMCTQAGYRPVTGRCSKGRIAPRFWYSNFKVVLLHLVGTNLIAGRYILAGGLCSGVLMTLITNAAFIYLEYFKFPVETFPLYFSLNVICLITVTMSVGKIIKHVEPQALFKIGVVLQFTILTSFTSFTTLVLMGISEKHIIIPVIALAIGCGGLIQPCITAMLMAYFRRYSGSAASLATAIKFSFGGILGGVSNLLFDATLLPVCLVMLVSSLLCLMVIFSIPKQHIVAIEEQMIR